MDNTLDAAAATAAITSPVWLEYVDKGLTTYMVCLLYTSDAADE